jgi:hypothetical protein
MIQHIKVFFTCLLEAVTAGQGTDGFETGNTQWCRPQKNLLQSHDATIQETAPLFLASSSLSRETAHLPQQAKAQVGFI